MSHTYRAGGGTLFHHDGDFGGDVKITVPAEPVEMVTAEGGTAWMTVVPFADLRELVFAYLRARKIEQLEQCSDDAFEAALLGTSTEGA